MRLTDSRASIAQALGSSREKVVESFDKAAARCRSYKEEAHELCSESSRSLLQRAFQSKRKSLIRASTCIPHDEEADDDYHIAIGEKAIELDKHLVYLALVSKGQGIRVIVFVVSCMQEGQGQCNCKAGIQQARWVWWW